MSINEPHKSRIIGHMNSDHFREIEEYLRAFNGVSASAARGAQIADMTLTAMTIKSVSGTHSVAITPPLKDANDARIVLVDMAMEAKQKLGLSPIRVSSFTPPSGFGLLTFAGVVTYFVCAATYSLVVPKTQVWALLDQFWPGGASGYKWIVRALFAPVIVCHVGEAWWMARGRLRRHSVEFGSKVWWLWTLGTFVEGLPAMRRFDRVVEAEGKKAH
ncbi:uncharacterized protein GGS22DRAFT_163734 [Annulohypoxylon maeteangense]|uniref:uncharacterized protein n=1 Tax=Annulohypoxylon maeteangense TaxID=1927788 RepID=UPI0020076A67|nr:uncharacterized protein GGS22DRAFT_163734 [Annulohypoxylon maeteangense]KAI0884528.1 hypothetical protein GGS22DRAFT_163734 [Annulohypoxylon maeteangense]